MTKPRTSLLGRMRDELAVPFRVETYRSAQGRPWYARVVYGFSGLIVMVWLVAVGVLNIVVPQLEKVVDRHAVAFMPNEASSVQALAKMGQYFGQEGTNNFTYVLLEGNAPLGVDAHRYYEALLERLLQDKQHVLSALNLWGDPLLASVNQSTDGKAAYVLVNLTGNLGTAQSLESTRAVRDMIAAFPPPAGIAAHLTGPGPVVSDELVTIGDSVLLMILACIVLVTVIVTIAYRSFITACMPLMTVGCAVWVARPVVAFLADHEVVPISTFASSLLVVIAFGAGADYGIFLLGRYQEARRAGEDPESAYYNAFTGVGHIILASGLTVAGATACMTFTRLALFSTSGLPCTVAVLVAIAAALTLGPALLAIGSRLGLFEPKEQKSLRRWRRIGAIVTRWPGPVLAASMAVLFLAIAFVPTFVTSYDERVNQTATGPSNLGFAAADRHLPAHILEPNVLILEADHDMRNPADLIALAKLSDAIAAVPHIVGVQSITRPLMEPLGQGTLTSQFGYIGNRVEQMTKLVGDRAQDMKKLSGQLGELNFMIRGLDQALGVGKSSVAQINVNAEQLHSQLAAITEKVAFIRDTAAPAQQFVSSIPNCTSMEICQAVIKGFSLFENVDQFDGIMTGFRTGGATAAQVFPQLSTELESLKGLLKQLRAVVDPLLSALDMMLPQASEITQFTREISDSFAQADPSQYFFLPSQALESPLFRAGMRLLFSPDGKVTRMLAVGDTEAFSQAGIDYSAQMVPAALAAIKGTSLAGSTVSVGGVGGTLLNIAAFAKEDFLTSAVAAFAFVFCVIMIVLRSFVAALVVIGTVGLSFLGALGATVFIWQHLLDQPLNWVVAPMGFTFLVAVGADYNLLLAARFRDEAKAGINTGIVRAMGSTGSVVTVAGFVFGFTMLAMLSSPALDIKQLGTMVGIGLLLDTLLVRSFIVPSIAVLLGRWFWWPLRIHARPRHTATPDAPLADSAEPRKRRDSSDAAVRMSPTGPHI